MADENETQDKRPFYKTVVSTVTGEMKGGVVGGLTGALILGVIGAAAGAVAGIALPLVAGGAVTIGGVAAGAGLIGGIGALIGGVSSAVTGAYAGAVTGWVNSRPQGKDALAIQQDKQIAFAQGMVQGVTLTKLEAVEQQAEQQKKWTEHVGAHKKPDQLFVEQEQQRSAKAALLAMQPQGRA